MVKGFYSTDKQNNFIKTEFSYDIKVGNYTGFGVKKEFSKTNNKEKSFSSEKMLAVRGNNSVSGIFGEYKINSSNLYDYEFNDKNKISIKGESRTRLGLEKEHYKNNYNIYANQRFSVKTNYNNGNFEIYNITGINSKFGNELNITPMSLTGIGYNFKKAQMSIYAEYENNKTLDLNSNKWKEVTSAYYIGGKLTF